MNIIIKKPNRCVNEQISLDPSSWRLLSKCVQAHGRIPLLGSSSMSKIQDPNKVLCMWASRNSSWINSWRLVINKQNNYGRKLNSGHCLEVHISNRKPKKYISNRVRVLKVVKDSLGSTPPTVPERKRSKGLYRPYHSPPPNPEGVSDKSFTAFKHKLVLNDKFILVTHQEFQNRQPRRIHRLQFFATSNCQKHNTKKKWIAQVLVNLCNNNSSMLSFHQKHEFQNLHNSTIKK